MSGARPVAETLHQDYDVVPARYVAEHPNPGEPLGFSGSQFAPRPGLSIDPASTPGVFEYPTELAPESADPYAPAPTATSGEWLRNGHWYTEQSIVYLERAVTSKNAVQLSFEFLTLTNLDENVLDAGQQLGYQPGWESTLGRYLGRDVHNRDHSVEFTFLGLTHWDFAETITAITPGTIIQSIDPFVNVPIFGFSDVQGLDQTSDFNSFELNYRVDRRLARDRMVYSRDSCWVRQATPSLLCSAMGGLRVIAINEGLNWFASSADGTGNYDVVTHNNLVGPQIAGEIFYEHTFWRIGIRGKGGALVNWASQSSTVRILNTDGVPLQPNRDEFAKNHSMSFAGGLNFVGEFRFRPTFGLRFSYDFLWVTDLALAQNQLTFLPSSPPEISDSHAILFHGATLGLEWYR